jgi:hypothetical protein
MYILEDTSKLLKIIGSNRKIKSDLELIKVKICNNITFVLHIFRHHTFVVQEDGDKLHNKDSNNLYSSPNNIRLKKKNKWDKTGGTY